MNPTSTTRGMTRRDLVTAGAAAVAGSALTGGVRTVLAQQRPPVVPATSPYAEDKWDVPGEPGKDYTPVVTPDGSTLPYKVVDGVKVFHLVAEPVKREFTRGLVVNCWGWNGQTPGPTIEAVEGDRVRIYVTNHLPEPTTIHWHGVLLPAGMDGVSGLTQRPIPVGETFRYEFTLRQHGTLMYHPHFDEMTQIAMGMVGMFVIHPRGVPPERRPHRDFALMAGEWAIKPGTYTPDPMEMTDFNVLTFNSRAFPGTSPLVAKLGDRVRIRLGNLGPMDHHPIHLHGYQFAITETDGGVIPESARWPETTALVAVGSTRTIEFVADNPGDWAMHCHMTHHTMNQMGHDLPNLIGVRPGELDARVRKLLPDYMTMGHTGMGEMHDMGPVPRNSVPMTGGKGPFATIEMGGMFTILKVRAGLTSYDDPGWYEHPKGTVAEQATTEELRRDAITVKPAAPATTAPAAYACPHHPEVVSDKPGTCPKCGMNLRAK